VARSVCFIMHQQHVEAAPRSMNF